MWICCYNIQKITQSHKVLRFSLCLAFVMWPWQPPTSSTHHPHYPTSSLAFHPPQPSHVSPHGLAAPLSSSQLPPAAVVGGQHYLYPNPSAGDFPFSSHISNQVEGWGAEPRQPTVQSDSVPLPFSSPIQPRADVHTPQLPTLPPPPLHPSQQATPSNVPPQPSPLPLTPSHPHTVPTRSPFSMDFILSDHAPPPQEGEMTPNVGPYPPDTGPVQGGGDPVATGYQPPIGDVMYQTPPPQSHPPHPHSHTSPQLQQTLPQVYGPEGGGVKQMTFNPGSQHYVNQSKRALSGFGGGGDGGVASFPPAVSPVPDATAPFPDSLQPFQLHSNYRPPPVSGSGNEAEVPYSPPELIPHHHHDNNQSEGLNQSHDSRALQAVCSQDRSGSSEEPLVTNKYHTGTSSGHQTYHEPEENTARRDGPARPRPPSPTSPGSEGLLIDVTDSSQRKPHPPSHLPIKKSESPPVEDDFDVRPSAPKPPPLVRRDHNSSDEEDDVFLPPPIPTVTPSHKAPSSTPSPHPLSPHTLPPGCHDNSEPDEDGTEKADNATTPGTSHTHQL